MRVLADQTTTLAPDYSWVPSELGSFIGGIQAICIVVLVIAVIAGVLRFILARVTTTRVDDAIGDRVLISVIVACFFIAGLGQLVGDQMGAWDTDASTNSSMVYGTNSSNGVGEDTGNLIGQIKKHGVVEGVKRTASEWTRRAQDAAGKVIKGAKNMWDNTTDWVEDRGKDLGNLITGGAKKAVDVGSNAWNAVKDFFRGGKK